MSSVPVDGAGAGAAPAHTVRIRSAAFAPSLADCLFIALLVWLFVAGHGWSGLLADGDTGWHIRTGDFVLDQQRFPRHDFYSFSRPGEAWYAWEWLADTALAAAHRAAGLKGVVLLAGVVIAGYLTFLFRDMVGRGCDLFLALATCLLAAGASGIHFLARPHIFTLLLLAFSLWLLDRDRERPSARIWLLVPTAALWVNVHGGFTAVLACLALIAAGRTIEAAWDGQAPLGVWMRARRSVGLLGACSLATLVNPYGLELHAHILSYLRSDWIREAVHEFQSPKFRSESALHFEILLFAGLLAAGSLLRRRHVAEALLVVLWAHAALVSVRHIPVYVVVAGPIVCLEASRLWRSWADRRPGKSVAGVLLQVAADLSAGFRRMTWWAAAAVAGLALLGSPMRWPRDFPEQKFPVSIVARHAARLHGARVFASDQWGDYLLYRFYPRQRVFVDGRSDFYGRALGQLYLKVAGGHPGSTALLDRHSIAYVLAEPDWPLAALLRRNPGWRLMEEDATAALFARVRTSRN